MKSFIGLILSKKIILQTIHIWDRIEWMYSAVSHSHHHGTMRRVGYGPMPDSHHPPSSPIDAQCL
jgi:hypothetical protein